MYKILQLLEQAVALALAVIVSPLATVIGLVIALESRGGILFRQVRVAKNMGSFVMFKFRTMYEGAHDQHPQLFSEHQSRGRLFVHIPEDRRATRFGLFLRKSGLDELPQLINVIKGEMSFVGPRPMLPEELNSMPVKFQQRFEVKPGITGLSQINGRGSLPTEKYLGLDLLWVRRKSLWLALKVVSVTPFVMLRSVFRRNEDQLERTEVGLSAVSE